MHMTMRKDHGGEAAEGARSRSRALVIHPFLFALWPIVFAYSQNQEYVAFSQAWTFLTVLLGSTLVMFLLFAAILRSAMRAGAIVSLFVVLFFSFGPFFDLLWEDRAGYALTGQSLALMIAWVLIFAGGTAIVFRIRRHWLEITRALNVVALTLVLVSMASIGFYEIRERMPRRQAGIETLDPASVDTLSSDTLPNIYYIILDAYARQDILEDVYGYDNSEFLDFLMEQGFYVAEGSLANYAQTDLSLASSLNLGYFDDKGSLAGSESADRRPLESLIQENTVVRFLRGLGYTIVGVPSGYNPTSLRNSDIHPEMGRTWNELEIRLLCSTPIPWLAYRGGVFDPFATHRQKILFALDHIADTAQLPGPQFVFAHVLAPHGPFVFDENGNPIDPQRPFDLRDGVEQDEMGRTLEEDILGYSAQLAFINSKITSVLEALSAQSSRPTIVILQSDHGPSWPLNLEEPGSARLRERMAILNAYLLPGDGLAGLYQEITPVNTFRLIFNQYLGTYLEMLEDRSYYSTWMHPYRFVDVTDEIQADGPLQPTQ
jgi:hypothetical protein